MTKSQGTGETVEIPVSPVQRKCVCKYTDPETGQPCAKRFNERANLKVSHHSIIILFRFTSEEFTLKRGLIHAHSALKDFLWSVTEMTTCGDTQELSPTSVPCLAAIIPTSASTSWWAMAGPENIEAFLLTIMIYLCKTCQPQTYLFKIKLLSPKFPIIKSRKYIQIIKSPFLADSKVQSPLPYKLMLKMNTASITSIYLEPFQIFRILTKMKDLRVLILN